MAFTYVSLHIRRTISKPRVLANSQRGPGPSECPNAVHLWFQVVSSALTLETLPAGVYMFDTFKVHQDILSSRDHSRPAVWGLYATKLINYIPSGNSTAHADRPDQVLNTSISHKIIRWGEWHRLITLQCNVLLGNLRPWHTRGCNFETRRATSRSLTQQDKNCSEGSSWMNTTKSPGLRLDLQTPQILIQSSV